MLPPLTFQPPVMKLFTPEIFGSGLGNKGGLLFLKYISYDIIIL